MGMCAKPKGPTCEAWQLLVRFSFTQRASLPAVAAELELSPAQCHLMTLIDPDRPMPMGELAGALSCDASNVTGLVDRLESRGVLQRSPSAEDRRVKVLSLTPLGRRWGGCLRPISEPSRESCGACSSNSLLPLSA